MMREETSRHQTKVIGRIDPDALYTVEGCLEFCGIGGQTLSEARRSGVVKPFTCGKRRYYRGDQLIAFITKQGSLFTGIDQRAEPPIGLPVIASPVGTINAECVYSTLAVKEIIGIKDDELREGRRLGLLRPAQASGQWFYRGCELIEYLFRRKKSAPPPLPEGSFPNEATEA